MAQMGLLLLILSTLLFLAYIIDDRDIMSPSVLFIAGFVLAVIAAMMNIQEWGIDLTNKTVIIIIIGNGAFLLTDMIYKLTHRESYSGAKEELTEIKIENWKTGIVILVGIVTMLLYYREIVRLSAYAESYWQKFGVMVAYKRAITYGTVSISTITNQMTKLVYSF